MRLRRWLAWVPVVLVCEAPRLAGAEPPPALDARRFAPPVDPSGTLYLESASVQAKKDPTFGAWLSYARAPFTLRRGGDPGGKVIGDQLSLDLGASAGVGGRAQVGLALPVALAQGGDDTPGTREILGGSTLPARAVGDLAVLAKVNVKPLRELGGTGLALVGRFSLPTGDRASGLGEGAATTEVRALGELRLVSLSVLGSLGFRLRTEERTIGTRRFGDEIPWALGLSVKPQMFKWDDRGRWVLGIESHGWLPAGPSAPFGDAAASGAYVGATAKYALRDAFLMGGVESGFVRGPGNAPLRVVVGYTWSPREHDQDHDGIDDDHDECKFLAEDKDGFEDDDGCPEADNDDDGVMDTDDKCPLVPEDEDGFEDDDGCPDLDNDKDGVPDTEDACPDEAGPRSGDPTKSGCPNRDRDDDGIPDATDKCPDEPEDKDGFEDDDGCPDPDDDGDGIPDAEDACPEDKGEPSEDKETNGCPSPDRDHDGIPNELDQCPDEPETYNGFKDEDGCPDVGPPGSRPLARLTEGKGGRSLALLRAPSFERASPTPTSTTQATMRAIGLLLSQERGLRVVIAVRPLRGPEGDDLARSRAAALAEIIRRTARRIGAATVVDWKPGAMPRIAEPSGVSVDLTTTP